jgi:uncharacterized UPF0160 family protein
MAEVKRLNNEELDRVTQEDWASCIKHAKNLQEEYSAKEIGWHKIYKTVKQRIKKVMKMTVALLVLGAHMMMIPI